MTRHIHTRIVAALLATMLLVGAVAAPAAAGLPDPPDRPNNHDVDVADGFYDGGVLVVKTKDTTVTETKTWTVDCDGNRHELSVTHRNEYGLSLSGPLGDAEQNGVEEAVRDLRPEKRGSVTDEKNYTLPNGNKKVTIKNTATYQHTHYKIYIGGSSRIELIGYIHIKTREKSDWDPKPRSAKIKKACGGGGGGGGRPPVVPPGRWPKGPQPFAGAHPAGPRPANPTLLGYSNETKEGERTIEGEELELELEWNGPQPSEVPQQPTDLQPPGPYRSGPQSTERSSGGDVAGHPDGDSDFVGYETADEATILLSERLRNVDVPGVAKGAVAAKRINVEVDGGTVGLRTDDDGHPVSVRTVPYENPDATVTVDDATLRDLEGASDPVATARSGIVQDRIEYSTNDAVQQTAFYTAEAGLRCASFARGVARSVGSFARGVASGL